MVTRSSDVSRVESTSSMVLRSHTRGGSSSAAIPDVEMRLKMKFQPEPEIDSPAEMQVSMSAIHVCEGSSGATRPDIYRTA